MYKNIKDANNGYQELDWRERWLNVFTL
jgi:hypothetical protein